MKVLFVGLGSAGQRHLRNIKKIVGDNVEFLAFRMRGFSRVFDDSLNIIEDETLSENYKLQEFFDFNRALEEKPDIVIIANPNSMHMQFALAAAKAGCDLFIEKPIAVSLEKIDELKEITIKNKTKVYVGFQNRLHPCIKKLKEILDEGVLGNLISVSCEVGELLTEMHKYEDYRDMNESKKETGGGVVICQSHELDYLYWLFGLPEKIYSIGGKKSKLEIEVEDSASTLCKCHYNGYDLPIFVSQDFLQYPPNRNCKVIGEKGYVKMDLLKNSYEIYLQNHEAELYEFENFKRNDMFYEEMELFLKCVHDRGREYVGLEDGCGSLKWALAIKESMCTDDLIRMEN